MGSTSYGDFVQALDNVRRVAPNGQEYWMGRSLQGVLNYARWENFEASIEKAVIACANSGVDTDGQFRRTTKLITHGRGGRPTAPYAIEAASLRSFSASCRVAAWFQARAPQATMPPPCSA